MTISIEELQLAARNHGLPLEALRYDLTPVGLHYLLTHYDIPFADAAAWRLSVGGAVSSPLSLSVADLRALPAVTRAVTMECAGNGRALASPPRASSQPWLLEAVGNSAWSGARVVDVLARAGVDSSAVEVVFGGADEGVEGGVAQRYQRSLSLTDIDASDAFIAYDLNGAPLPSQHGFPLRLVVPGWYGMTSVKWLTTIDVVTEPFTGYQQVQAYRVLDEPVTRIVPRSLMVPPGVPDFFSRRRFVAAGRVELFGRAWSGFGAIVRVELSADGGATWADAVVEPPAEGWQSWRVSWDAVAGEWELLCRATDSSGRTQPLVAAWNAGGYVNNAVQRVLVLVS